MTLTPPLRRVLSVLGRNATDGELLTVMREFQFAPSDEPDAQVTTDEMTLEFRFENGVLIELWVNPGTGWELPRGLQWDLGPDEIRALLGPGTPLGIDKENPGAFQWLIAEEGPAKLFVHMNALGGFTLRGEPR